MPHTAPSHASMFTGLYPFQHGLRRNHEKLSPEFPNAYSVLKKAGVEGVAFPSVRFLDGKVAFPQSPLPLGIHDPKSAVRGWYLNAREVTDNALSWLDDKSPDDSLFIWLHYYDVHQWNMADKTPPRYVEMMRDSMSPELLEYVQSVNGVEVSYFHTQEALANAINNYDARLRFVDDEIKRFQEALEARSLGDETVWIVTSDHGEGLGDHGYAGHGQFLYEEQLRVPLIFWKKGWRKGFVRTELVRLVDLFPTFLELFGHASETPTGIEGRSLVALLEEGDVSWPVDASFAERRPRDGKPRAWWTKGELRSFQTKRWKIIESTETGVQLFDLQEDPLELSDRSTSAPSALAKYRRQLRELLERRPSDPEEKKIELDESQLEELRQLGYL